MASDTSDTDEFYDAPEDVHFSPSPKVSPAKFVIPSPQLLHRSHEDESCEEAASETTQDDSLHIIDSIIEESQKENGAGAELFDQLHVGVTAETESKEESKTPQVPLEASIAADEPKPSERPEEQPECSARNEVCSLPVPSPLDLPGPSVETQESVQPPDITSTIGQRHPDAELAVAEGDQEPRSADILEQVSFADRPLDSMDTSGPTKPPRQFTVEPDIVASTKKPPPSRPRPPSGAPPPRPPPPAMQRLPSKKSQQSLRPSGLEVSAATPVGSNPLEPSGLLSPSSTVRSLTRELQHSLDLASATSGDKVVTAQENEGEEASSLVEGQVPGPQRPRSNSGRELTDEEILASVMIKNLDTGEEIPLIQAEEKLPAGINPLTLHIMRRTKEYITNDEAQSDDDDKSQAPLADTDGGKLKQRTTQLKKFLGKSVKKAKHLAEEYGEKAVNKVKSVRDEVFHTDQDDPSSSDDEGMPYTRPAKFKAAHSFKGPFDFDQIKVVQDLSGEHMGAVWTMKFSHCGRLLATAGQDNVVRIWVLKTAFDYFNNMRLKYNTEGRVSPSPSQESLCSSKSDTDPGASCAPEDPDTEDRNAPFRQVPFCKYKGHTADLLDLSWSKNFFLLSSSMDKTVRLWHISRRECLCCFQHIDFVTAITFHPRDDRYFLSGSLDGKLRLWNIPDKKVALWNEVDGQTRLITAANFCQNGKYAVIGTYDGRCIFYDTERLKYHTQIHVRSTRGRNKVGRKITGIEPLPGENKILVTSNDSRIRLYDLRDLSLSMKYKGYVNSSSQIKASFSHDYSFIVSGSEDKYVYIWSTYHDLSKFTSVRRDRNDFWEGIKAHNAVVTSAIFAPHPGLIVPQETGAEKTDADCKSLDSNESETIPSGALKTDHTEVLLSADFTGAIKVFINVKKY
ncbi:WD repeat-containing protein 44 [Hippocampus comes]|uniref:WD repeat-containing protein 44 n=1 Tax=Hippocampus comes TaxID=109280 RepID=A0A3Q2YJP4_HIPCM|nr:PREDICTED: WD repeat-containing protein 44 [Hippocampus comes]XP_019728840.1 PREDICTED: WD repeat-containing protein 44 [Hippocampus comes]XP_019728841.1 PREDICTED: WD repeat-containing protein 44 [Hippocampus comes]XP_019728842.1 PREDICTED: WD repeat-containing protein 44 [Hippocampus comes]